MEINDKYFRISNTSFHIIETQKAESTHFIDDLVRELPAGGYAKAIDIADINDEQGIFKVFSDAFDFPDYFGRNWDAFNDCINDLTWLNASLYVLILKNIDKSKIDKESKRTLLGLLSTAASRWMKGENHNANFQNIPVPFHIVLAIGYGKADEIVKLLTSEGIKSIDA